MNYDYSNNYIYTNSRSIQNQHLQNKCLNIENILNLNKGKKVSIYASFNISNEWKDKIFKGIIEQANKDFVILSDPETGKWYLILNSYICFFDFDEEINTLEQFYTSNF